MRHVWAFIAVVGIVYLLESMDMEAMGWLRDLSERPAFKWGLIALLGLGLLAYLMGLFPGGRNDPKARRDDDEG